MKKGLLVLVSLLLTQVVMAKANYGMAGCGLGAVLLDPEGSQVLAATSNLITPSQGFGITSGTSGCLEADEMAALQTQQNFWAQNLQQISRDVAQGDGEYLQTLSQTFGCPATSYPEFANELQTQFNVIFSAPGAMAMLSRARTTIKMSPNLEKSCSKLIILGGA